MQNKWIGMALLLAFATGSAAAADSGVNPEDGKLTDGIYSNPYFGLSFPLPEGYSQGFDPAHPSFNGYYVLNTPARSNNSALFGQNPAQGNEPAAQASHLPVMLISAQDMFFSVKPMNTALGTATDFQHSTATIQDPKVDMPATEVMIGGHSFAEVRVSGKFLSHLVLTTAIRCHTVSINLTSPDPAVLDQIATSFDKISVPPEASATKTGTGDGIKSFPVCLKDYATPDTILHQVQPRLTSPKFLKIPARIIIGTDGKVKHVHVIRADDEGNKNDIEQSLMQWVFKPYLVNGQPAEVETGLLFENK